jgi:hypothetical protein
MKTDFGGFGEIDRAGSEGVSRFSLALVEQVS